MDHPNPWVREIASLVDEERLFALARGSCFVVRQRSLQLALFF